MKEKKSLRVILSQCHNPYMNISTENMLFKTTQPSSVHTLYLWQNSKTVIIGRHQNPWKECHLQKMSQDGVSLVRRKTGGGTVYQDLGNLCFTFISGYKRVEENNKILVNSLRKFSLPSEAEATGRNDITIDGKKISGSAFAQQADRHMHHGTMLVDVDLGALQSYLNPDKKKLQSKGIQSVSSRVVNLKQLDPQITIDAIQKSIIDSFFEHYEVEKKKIPEIEIMTEKSMMENPVIREDYMHLVSDDWKFGPMTPLFSHHLETRFDWGLIDIHLDCKEGKIENVVIYSDALFPELVVELTNNLKGAPYGFKGIQVAIEKTIMSLPHLEVHLKELLTWMEKAL